MASVSQGAPVPAPALAHEGVWYALYDAINQQSLDKSHVPTIPSSVASQGRIPSPVSRYINNAFAAGARDARAMALNATVFPVPDHDAEETATCVLGRYYSKLSL